MHIKVSIIVPVYNVECYLAKCLDSLINQSLKEIEIIVVNDCTLDDSEKIIREYQKKDPRIIYIKHQQNLGLGLTRNTGISAAKGEYLLFVDSDDYIDVNSTEKLYLNAKALNLDILEASYYKVSINNKILTNNPTKNLLVTDGEEHLASISYLSVVAWNKLWKASFIKENNLQFFAGYFEDIMFTLKAMLFASRVSQINYPFYYYIIRENSIMTSNTNKRHILDQQQRILQLTDIFNHNKTKQGSDQRLKILVYAFSSLARFIVTFTPKSKDEYIIQKEAKVFLTKQHRVYRKLILSCNKLGLPQKLLLFISPYLMNFVLNKIK